MSDLFASVLGLCIIASLALGTIFLGYVITIIIPFMRRPPDAEGDPTSLSWHFVIPCRDEEAVIGVTIAHLTSMFPGAHVWVVDDDSDDGTAAVVEAAIREQSHVHLIQRRRPGARTGKAHALNHAWAKIRASVPEAEYTSTILAVIDADGVPSENMLRICAGPTLFGDADIAAVQVEVRMSNRDVHTPLPEEDWSRNLIARTFVRMQDLEFRGPISAIQLSRRASKTVNVGGNGQLARFSALAEIDAGEGPWRGSLLEDFELGLHFLLAGWRNAYTPDAWVDQEALYSLPRFITQRARWAQGTMQCIRYLPRVWSNPHLSNLGALEVTYFLFQPWVQILGSLIYPVPLLVMLYNALAYPESFGVFLTNGGAAMLGVFLLIGFAEFGVWGFLYRAKSVPEAGLHQALGWGLYYTLYLYTVYAIVWKAFIQLLRGQNGWAKTIRNAEKIEASQLVARIG